MRITIRRGRTYLTGMIILLRKCVGDVLKAPCRLWCKSAAKVADADPHRPHTFPFHGHAW